MAAWQITKSKEAPVVEQRAAYKLEVTAWEEEGRLQGCKEVK